MKSFVFNVAIAVAGLLLGVGFRLAGFSLWPPVAALVYGVTIVCSGFLLSWGAESEKHFSRGLIIAGVALVTVLPEYSVDIYLAFQAGANPNSNYIEYAAANMTGANRMLIGLMWPLLVLISRVKNRQSQVELNKENLAEIAFLAIASLYAFVIVVRREISLLDLGFLLMIFAAYVWRVGKFAPQKEAEEPGPGMYLATLPPWKEHTIIASMVLAAAASIITVTEPFTQALIETGKLWGVNDFLLIQWLGPLASELPVIVVTVLFSLRQQSTAALASLISDKINQWTLLVGFLPLAFSLGAGHAKALPLLARQREEFLLTASQSLFGLALLLNMRLTVKGSIALLALFLAQLGLAFAFQKNQQYSIQILTVVSWIYFGLTGLLLVQRWRRLPDLVLKGLIAWGAEERSESRPPKSSQTK
jgi:cation:H+ antiporter